MDRHLSNIFALKMHARQLLMLGMPAVRLLAFATPLILAVLATSSAIARPSVDWCEIEVVDAADTGLQGADAATIIKLSGTIYFEHSGDKRRMVSEVFAEAIKRAPQDGRIILELSSHGGALSETTAMIDMIRAEIKNGRRFDTMVDNGSVCASSCIPLFLQGQKRFAGPASSFMFHAAVDDWGRFAKNATTRYLNIVRDTTISQVFLDKLIHDGIFDAPGVSWYTGQELWNQNANVATNLLDRRVVFPPVKLPFDPQIRPR